MLSGKSTVYIDPLKSGEVQANEQCDHLKTHTDLEIEKVNIDGSVLDRSIYGKKISAYDAGKSFGEFALINKDSVRNATVIADEETDTMVIDRETFDDTLKAVQEQESQEHIDFVNSCHLFQTWNNRFKRLLEMSVKKVELPYGSDIVKQGEPVQGLHFIVKGEAKILVNPSTHKYQYPKLFDPENVATTKEVGQKCVKKGKKREILQQKQVHIRRRYGYSAAEKRLNHKILTLCIVDQSEVIGDAEIALGLDTYAHTVVCTSNTQLFLLDNKNIERFITKKYTATLDQLRDEVLEKLRSRQFSKLGGYNIEVYTRMIDALEEIKPKRLLSEQLESKRSITQEEEVNKTTDINQLVDLYLSNKAQLIDPYVPGAVFYKTKSIQRARKRMMDRLHRYQSTRDVTPQVRLERARKAARRQPRSRRELERLTIAKDPEEASKLHDRHHAVNRFLSSHSQTTTHASGILKPRPHTAIVSSRLSTKSGIFKFTEPQLSDETSVHAVDYSDIQEDDVKQIIRDMETNKKENNTRRVNVIYSMISQNNNHVSGNGMIGGYRPKSAPNPGVPNSSSSKHWGINEDIERETFDQETSETTLSALEEKIRAFHDKYDDEGCKKGASQIQQLKRFNITRPADVPIPGGTVYVRQKECKFFPVANNNHHQHIRRFIIPKDAAAIASRALTTLNSQISNTSGMSRMSIDNKDLTDTCAQVKHKRPVSEYNHRNRPKSVPRKTSLQNNSLHISTVSET